LIFTYLKRVKHDFYSFELILPKSKYMHIAHRSVSLRLLLETGCTQVKAKLTGSLYWILVLDPCTGSLYWILVLDPCTGTLYWILVLDRIKKQQYLGVHSFVSCRLAGEKLVNFCIWQLIDWECGKPFHFNYSFKFFKPSKTPVHFKFQGHLQAARARASSTVHRQTT